MKLLAISHPCVISVNREIFEKLASLGIEVTLITPEQITSDGRLIRCDPLRSGSLVSLKRLKFKGEHLRWQRYEGLAEAFAEADPDICYVDADPVSRVVLDLSVICRQAKIPLACLTSENLYWGFRSTLARCGPRELGHAFYKSALHQVAKRRVNHVFASSEDTRSNFDRAGYKSTSIIPLGFDSKVFRYRSAKRRERRLSESICDKELVIAYFGRLSEEKGVMTLVDALADCMDQGWTLFLNKYGTTTAYSQKILERLTETGLNDRVKWVVSAHGEISTWMNASDIVVVPSLSRPKWVEQFGRVVTEAMATGNIVIVSDSGTPKELVGDAGIVFPEGDVIALRHHLRTILAKPRDFLTLRKAALRRARRYSVDAQARLMKVQFERLAGVADS